MTSLLISVTVPFFVCISHCSVSGQIGLMVSYALTTVRFEIILVFLSGLNISSIGGMYLSKLTAFTAILRFSNQGYDENP
jgi:hypothetical protein